MKFRIPRFLVPRRKYEVNESLWIVKFGRPKLVLLLRGSRRAILYLLLAGAGFGMIIVRAGMLANSLWRGFSSLGRKTVLFCQWGRMPKEWEVSFVQKMKSAESQGVPFPEVLQTNLPLVLGEAPSDVLMRWVGRKARSQPRQFVDSVNEMFGKSGKRIIIGLRDTLDPGKMLEAKEPEEEKFQALIDAIQQADAAGPDPPKFIDKDRWKRFSE